MFTYKIERPMTTDEVVEYAFSQKLQLAERSHLDKWDSEEEYDVVALGSIYGIKKTDSFAHKSKRVGQKAIIKVLEEPEIWPVGTQFLFIEA